MPGLLRLAAFCGAPRRALAKTGALRHSQLPVSATGSGRCSCLLRLADFRGAGRCPLAKTGALLRVAVPCFCFGRRSALTKDRPRPLLCFGCFVHWTRLSCAASGGSLLRPLDAVAVRAPSGRWNGSRGGVHFVGIVGIVAFDYIALSVSLRSPALPHAGEPKRNL